MWYQFRSTKANSQCLSVLHSVGGNYTLRAYVENEKGEDVYNLIYDTKEVNLREEHSNEDQLRDSLKRCLEAHGVATADAAQLAASYWIIRRL